MSVKSKYFYKVDKNNNPVPGNLVKANKKPLGGNWRQIPTNACCDDLCPVCPPPPCSTTLTYAISYTPNCSNLNAIITINNIPVITVENSAVGALQQTLGILTVYEGDVVSITSGQTTSCLMNGTILIEGTVEGIIQDFTGQTSSTGNLTDPIPFTVNCESEYTASIIASTSAS